MKQAELQRLNRLIKGSATLTNRKWIVALVVVLASWGLLISEVWPAEPVELITEDQKNIAATYYPVSSSNPSAVILLPDTRCDWKKSFGRFPSKVNKAGFAVLAMDMRYKKLIAGTKGIEEGIKTLQAQDVYAPVNYEVKTALDFLIEQKGVHPDRIALIGTSYGTRVGLVSAVKYNVAALVLLSLSGEEALPGEPIKGLLEKYGDRPILFMTTERDWGGNYKAAEHNKLYYNWAKGKKELKIWKGSGHGGDILKKRKASEFIISWLKENLQK